jgi:hypothetical protein
MASVTQTQTPSKAFQCTLYDEPGALAKVGGSIIFFRDADSAMIDYEPEMAPWTCILGEIGLSEAQALADRRHGGAPRICTTRSMEVA